VVTVMTVISYLWRGVVRNAELNALHAEGFEHRVLDDDGQARAARCEWLHVDFGEQLRSLYFDSCGFRPTQAGLIAL